MKVISRSTVDEYKARYNIGDVDDEMVMLYLSASCPELNLIGIVELMDRGGDVSEHVFHKEMLVGVWIAQETDSYDIQEMLAGLYWPDLKMKLWVDPFVEDVLWMNSILGVLDVSTILFMVFQYGE